MDQLSDEDLMKFFRHRKTEVVCMENPNLFLQLLRDHDLVPGDLFQEVMKMKSKEKRVQVVYEILDRLEKRGGMSVRRFWKCVFQDHIQMTYSALRSFKREILGGSVKTCETHSTDEKPTIKEEKEEQKKGGTKRKISDKDDADDEEEDENDKDDDEEESGFLFASPLKKSPMKKEDKKMQEKCGTKKKRISEDDADDDEIPHEEGG